MSEPPAPFNETPAAAKARSRRNIAIALALVVFVILVFIVTLARLGGDVANRPL
jgi:hypothetical protein